MTPQSISVEQDARAQSTDSGDSYPLVRLAFRFWEAKVLLSAVQLRVFDELERHPLEGGELAERIGLHSRGARDFLDSLVALGLLNRIGGRYGNAAMASQYLVRTKATYIGGLMELADNRLYPVWRKLGEALRTGEPQNEAQQGDYYDNLSQDPNRLKVFLEAMTGLSMDSSEQICRRFEWQEYSSFADIGGAQGVLAVQLARRYPHLTGASFDLPAVEPVFEAYVASFGLADRLKFCCGNFFTEALPSADVLMMGHVLHNWSVDEKILLIQKAYTVLPPKGALLVYDAVIDEDRSQNAFALLMSLNMLLVTSGGHTYTASECTRWMREAGFRSTRVEQLTPADSLIVAIK